MLLHARPAQRVLVRVGEGFVGFPAWVGFCVFGIAPWLFFSAWWVRLWVASYGLCFSLWCLNYSFALVQTVKCDIYS